MKARRALRGSQIAEFGPALFILFVVILFPLILLVRVAVIYLTCASLHYAELQEAAIRSTVKGQDCTIANWEEVEDNLSALEDRWKRSPIGLLLPFTVSHEINVPDKGTTTVRFLHIRNKMKFSPGLPGVGKQTFQFDGERSVENVI
jgi:hypothetical protein